MSIAAWEEELGNDVDRDFILNGLKNGFDIIDGDASPTPVHCENHRSAMPASAYYNQATRQVLKEIEKGNYIVVSQPPEIISPIGVIPKPDGGVRLIHDCSRPDGLSVNDYCTADWKQKFSTVDDAASLVTPGCFMAKVDLKSAYRSVPISTHSQRVTGLKWQFGKQTVYLRDTKLCFGSKLAPGIFHRLTQAVKRMLKRHGLRATVVYLDDFFIKADSFEDCLLALNTLISLLRKLGFQINWNKVVDPTTRITFLGIEIDSMEMCLRLPDEKLHQVRDELLHFQTRKRASKKQLQSLAGKLNFCASVIYGGRVYSRRIIDTINMLKADDHKIKLTGGLRADISWWQAFMAHFNGKSLLLDKHPIQSVFTDSCNLAAGGFFEGDWFYLNWDLDWPLVSQLHINSKELLAVYLAVCRWAPHWQNKRIYIQSDNVTTIAAINRGTSRNPFLMACLRRLFWLSAQFNFHITARHLPAVVKTLADNSSRLHEPNKFVQVLPFVVPSPLQYHMSQTSLSFLFPRLQGQRETV
ncbi:MAG: reverse transcriptase domain-containing protein [Candidatus Thiodiazotropha sp.]